MIWVSGATSTGPSTLASLHPLLVIDGTFRIFLISPENLAPELTWTHLLLLPPSIGGIFHQMFRDNLALSYEVLDATDRCFKILLGYFDVLLGILR